MPQTWFYEFEGQPHGPFSSEEIKALVATGLLGAEDHVWAEGTDPDKAVPASTLSDGGTTTPAAAGSVPDWLADVASLEASKTTEPAESLDWLEDLRIWMGLELQQARQKGGSARTQVPTDIPVAKPVARAKRKLRNRHAAEDSIPIAMPVESGPAEAEVVPEGELELPLRTIDTLARQTLAETGFDFKTGQVVDAAKFKKWRKAKSMGAGRPEMTNDSHFEQFRRARTAIESWVEDPKNAESILRSTVEQIKNRQAIQDIYTQYAGFGFRQKLEKYLEFLVVGRKKQHEREKSG